MRYVVAAMLASLAAQALSAFSEPGDAPAITAPSPPQRVVSADPALKAKDHRSVATADGAAADSLSYGWKPGYSYTYRVESKARLVGFDSQLDGTVRYAVESVDPDGAAVVTVNGTFSHSQTNRTAFPLEWSSENGRGASRFSSERQHGVQENTNIAFTAKADRHGWATRETVGWVPFPFGFLPRSLDEPLPSADEMPTPFGDDVRIVIPEGPGLSGGPSANRRQEPSTEYEATASYVRPSTGPTVGFRKTHWLAVVAQADGTPRRIITSEDDSVLDRQAGVFTSATLRIQVTLYEEGETPTELLNVMSYELVGMTKLQ